MGLLIGLTVATVALFYAVRKKMRDAKYEALEAVEREMVANKKGGK